MLAITLEHDNVHGEAANSVRAEEEACRQKIVALREGLRKKFHSHGVVLNQGMSNTDLVASVAQLCGQPPIRLSEYLGTSWMEEYESVAQRIGSLVGKDHFTSNTEPQEIIQAIQPRFLPDKKKER